MIALRSNRTRKPGRAVCVPGRVPESSLLELQRATFSTSFWLNRCKPEGIGGASDYYLKTSCRSEDRRTGTVFSQGPFLAKQPITANAPEKWPFWGEKPITKAPHDITESGALP